jgi:hypothetical protein
VVVALDHAVDLLHLDVVAGLDPEQGQLAGMGPDSAPTSGRYQVGELL